MANQEGTADLGKQVCATLTCAQNYKFAGMERDAETSHDHTMFRQYASNLGRWMSPDPVAGQVTNPQSLSRYAYVMNNPTTLTDPLGLQSGSQTCGHGIAVPFGENPATWCYNHMGIGEGSSPAAFFSNTTDPFDLMMPGGFSGGGNGAPGSFSEGFDPNGAALAWTLGTPPLAPGGAGGCIYSSPVLGCVPAPSQNNETPCTLTWTGGDYTVGPNAVPIFQPEMAIALSSAFVNLNRQGIVPMITSGFRSAADQLRMRQGASGPNPAAIVSWHQVGMAVDLSTVWGNFSAIQAAMSAQSFTWGGTFTTPDPVHFQLPRAGTSPSAAMVKACGGR